MSGGAPTPCQAPETNSTTAIHLAQQTEWAETLQDNKVSAPWETVPFGITMRACVLAWAFLQEGELGTLCGHVFFIGKHLPTCHHVNSHSHLGCQTPVTVYS